MLSYLFIQSSLTQRLKRIHLESILKDQKTSCLRMFSPKKQSTMTGWLLFIFGRLGDRRDSPSNLRIRKIASQPSAPTFESSGSASCAPRGRGGRRHLWAVGRGHTVGEGRFSLLRTSPDQVGCSKVRTPPPIRSDSGWVSSPLRVGEAKRRRRGPRRALPGSEGILRPLGAKRGCKSSKLVVQS